jgi:predicted metal-dependent peptidase
MTTISTEQRITRANIAIMRSSAWGFLGGIIKTGAVSLSNDVPTAATDGYNVVYNPRFIESLTDQEIRFLVLHENMHKAYKHMSLWQGLHRRNPQLANAAMDYVINIEILDNKGDLDVSMPAGGLYDTAFRGMDTPTVFRLLEQDGEGGTEPKYGKGSPLDEHEMGDADITDEQAAELEVAIRQAAGSAPGNKARELQNAVARKRNWREALMDDWATIVPGRDDQSWARVNPVYLSMGIYLPGSVTQAAKHVNFCIDTSGSITQETLSMAAATVADLCKTYPPESLNVIWWDTEAHVQTVPSTEYANVATLLKPQGGGGTDPRCLLEHLTPDAYTVILTDGWFGTTKPEEWPDKLVWLLTNDGTDKYIGSGKVMEM